MADPAPQTALPSRARSVQVLQAVGAVLVVSAAAGAVSVHGGLLRGALIVGAALAAWLSLEAAGRGLRSSEETLAACAVGLAAAGALTGADLLHGSPVPPLLLAAACLGLTVVTRTLTWPLAAWGAVQLAVLRALPAVPPGLHLEVCLAVALVGLGIALAGRRPVARVALLTTAPWWLAGVVAGLPRTWTGDGAARWAAAGLVVGAAAGLLAARERRDLRPLLGPPLLVPVISGVVAGAAGTGAVSSAGSPALVAAGYAGVWLANLAALLLRGEHRRRFLPVAVTAGTTTAALCLGHLAGAGRWPALSLLFLLTAVPTLAVAVGRPDDRPVAGPTAVGCGAAAVLLALPDGPLHAPSAAVYLTALYALAMGVGAHLDPTVRRPLAVVAAGCAVAALAVQAQTGDRLVLAGHLAVQGLSTLAWARLTDRAGEPEFGVPGTAPEEPPVAWRMGAAQLMLAAWAAAAAAGWTVPEAYTLPPAAGLLLGAGPRLLAGRSWPVWGPALLVAALPSTLLAVVQPGTGRVVGVLVVAAAAMVAGARWGVRAPLLVGAGSALAVPLGLTARALPWPIGAALLVGAVLLAVGTRRERRPVAGFGTRLADLR